MIKGDYVFSCSERGLLNVDFPNNSINEPSLCKS